MSGRNLTIGSLLWVTLLVVVLACQGSSAVNEKKPSHVKDVPEATKLIIDENKKLDDESFGEIIKDFGEHVEDVMTSEMDQLFNDLERRSSSSKSKPTAPSSLQQKHSLDRETLERLRNANEAVTRDIRARIELAGKKDQSDLPQAGLNMKAVGNFVSKAQDKLLSAGSYIGQKMNSLGGLVKGVPTKLRKILQWPSFLNFKIKFNKNYKSLREELYRQMIYLHTQTRVGVQQMKFLLHREKSILKATEFADMTNAEYYETYNNELAEGGNDPRNKDNYLKPETLAKLERLAKEGKNIMGMDMSVRQSRRRRDITVDTSELDDDEEFSDASESFDAIQSAEEITSETTEEDEKVIDQYAAAFNDDLDDEELKKLDAIVDDAMADTEDEAKPFVFEPIDLRETGCIITPENQEGCGCCYAYAATAIASYHNCMAAKKAGAFEGKKVKPDRYAPRFLASCGRYATPEEEYPLMNGCRGGRISAAIAFLGAIGTMNFMDYEFAQISAGVYGKMPDECAYPRPASEEEFKALGKVKVPMFENTELSKLKGLDEVNLHLRTVGPVVSNIFTWKDFKEYGGGIHDARELAEETIMHSTVVVGHERDQNGRDYLIILNSHGTAWGERGFARIYWDSLKGFLYFFGGIMPKVDE